MWTRIVVVAAVVTYSVIAGCSLLDAKSQDVPREGGLTGKALSAAVAREGLPYRSVTMQIQRVDWIDKYKQSIDEIADVGADTVKLVVDSRQENGSSSRIYLDMRMTPTPDQLSDLIRHAKSKNLRVILMPIVLLDKPRRGEWRGKIAPEDWTMWWESYREMITHFAWIAQGTDVDLLVVGSELVSTEAKTNEWRETISQVRDIFKGKLVYSANWDHYAGIEFWDDLDLVGMNSYWKLGETGEATIDEIKDNWKPIREEVLGFAQRKNKPLMFMEVGWCSMENAPYEPWDYTTDDPIDNDVQKRLYEAFFEVWHGDPGLGGFSVWEWSPTPDPNDSKGREETARGYTPEGKPAEDVLRQWLAKPAWEVK